MYSLDRCSWYSTECIGGIEIVIFDDHNKALPVWGTYSAKNRCPYKLITFDYHADTRPPFHTKVVNEFPQPESYRKSKEVQELLHIKPGYQLNNFNFEDVFVITCYIKNDEQIKTAVDFGYLDSYTVICKHEIEGYQEDDILDGYNAQYFKAEQFFLPTISKLVELTSDSPTVLDFDLDFFSSKDEMAECLKVIEPLVHRAKLITIARELEYFEECRSDNSFSNEEAERFLMSNLRNIII